MLISIWFFLSIINDQQQIIERSNQVEADWSFFRNLEFEINLFFGIVHQIGERFSILKFYALMTFTQYWNSKDAGIKTFNLH